MTYPFNVHNLLSRLDCLLLLCSDLSNAASPHLEHRHALAMQIQRAALTAGFFYSGSGGAVAARESAC